MAGMTMSEPSQVSSSPAAVLPGSLIRRSSDCHFYLWSDINFRTAPVTAVSDGFGMLVISCEVTRIGDVAYLVLVSGRALGWIFVDFVNDEIILPPAP